MLAHLLQQFFAVAQIGGDLQLELALALDRRRDVARNYQAFNLGDRPVHRLEELVKAHNQPATRAYLLVECSFDLAVLLSAHLGLQFG